MKGTLTTAIATIRHEHKTYRVELANTARIVVSASAHHFQGTPFLYAFYAKDAQAVTYLWDPEFENPYPYGYDDAGNIFFTLTTPFTGVLVLTCTVETSVAPLPFEKALPEAY